GERHSLRPFVLANKRTARVTVNCAASSSRRGNLNSALAFAARTDPRSKGNAANNRLCDRNDESRTRGNSAHARGKAAHVRNKSCRIDADYSRHDRKSTAVGYRPASCFAINDETSWSDIRGLPRNHRG